MINSGCADTLVRNRLAVDLEPCGPIHRYADIDLHRWLKGSYVVPGSELGKDVGDEEE